MNDDELEQALLETRLAALEARLEPLEARIEPLERAVARLQTAQIETEPASATAPPFAGAAPADRFDLVVAVPTASAQHVEPTVEPRVESTTEPARPAWPPADRPRRPSLATTAMSAPAVDIRATLADLEERMAGRALVFVGGVALVLGAILFLGLAFSQGWIDERARVALGLIAGSAGLAVGAGFMERGNRLLGHVLTPVGLAVITISLVAATQLYDLIPVPAGLALALFAAAVTAVIAIRADSQLVAGFGLVAVLAAPPLLGASPDMITLAFIGIALVGTTAIALWRTWAWLPPLAFALSAPQAASWLLGESNVAFGLVGLAAFTLLQAVAAGGEEFRRRRDDLSPSSATLLLASAAFLVWGGFVLLDGDLVGYRMTFLIIAALGYLGLGSYFIVRDGDRHLFGLMAAGTGLAALTMSFPIGLGAPAVPVAWTVEATVLAWVAVRRPHPYGALVSGLLYGLACAWLVLMVFWPGLSPEATVPFAHGGGAALATFLVGVVAGIALVPIRAPRQALAGLGLGVAAWCALVELSGPPVVFAEMAVVVAGAALLVGLPRLPVRVVDWRPDGLIGLAWPTVESLGPLARLLVPSAAVVAGAVATAHLLVVEMVVTTSGWGDPPTIVTTVPFVSDLGLTLGIYLAALVAVAWLQRSGVARQRLAALGVLVAAAVCPAELQDVALVAAWSALAVFGLAMWRWLKAPAAPPVDAPVDAPGGVRVVAAGILPADRDAAASGSSTTTAWRRRIALLPASALFVGGLAVARTLAEMPPSDILRAPLPAVPFTDAATAMTAILAAAAVLGGLVAGGPNARRSGILLAGAAVAWTIPFQVEAWAVAVLWSALAIAAFVAARLEPAGHDSFLAAGGAMLALAAADALLVVAPPSRLTLPDGIDPLVALESLVALASLVVAVLAAIALFRGEWWTRRAEVVAGVGVVYLVSIGVVDAFAIQVGGSTSIEELRWQSQAALSVAWALMGMAAFGAGLRLGRAELRVGGLILLGITTAKVFVIDLAALEVAYKVMALIGLGLVLLVSGGLWQRLHKPPPGAPHGPAAVHP